MIRFKTGLTGIVTTVFTLSILAFSGSVFAKGPNYTTKDLNEQLVMATVWIQTSAEFRALCYQEILKDKIVTGEWINGNY